MSTDKPSGSAQVNMLAKMREQYQGDSALNNILNKAKLDKEISIKNHQEKASSSEHGYINSSTKLGELIEIDPSICKPWDFADRDELEMGNIGELANSIKANGQQEPVLIRPIKSNNQKIKYEIIFGHRRWKACLLCNKPLLAMVKVISDKEAAIAQKEENQNRENLSDYSRAFNYKKLLESKVFQTQTELAAYLGIPKNTLNVLLNYTKIPRKLLEAIKLPHQLPQRTALKIAQLTEKISEDELKILCEIGPGFINGKIPYKDICKNLLKKTMEGGSNLSKTEKYKTITVRNSLNVKLFTAGLNHNKAPSITFHNIVTDNDLYDEAIVLISNFLKDKTDKI